jgi:hypothetical protein
LFLNRAGEPLWMNGEYGGRMRVPVNEGLAYYRGRESQEGEGAGHSEGIFGHH